jgi:S-adenosylmethionine-diacylgycerolhomoserine-N-methlytransferase
MTGGAFEQVLDRNYRYQRHIYDLTREYYLLGRNTLIAGLAPADGASILEIGCGTARNLILAAREYPRAELYGIDLSRVMLETAQRKLAQRNLTGRIYLAHADAAGFDAQALLGRRVFDRVFFSYSLSMIPPWQEALRHAVGLLSPQGSLDIVDFGRGNGLPRVFDRALDAWLRRFHVTRRMELEPFLRKLAHEAGAEFYFADLYMTYAAYAVLRMR